MVNSKKNNTVRVPVNIISSSKSDQAVEKPTVGFIGLGIMGSAMSKNLHQAGFHVYGFDPSPKQQKLMKKEGIDIQNTVSDVASKANKILLSFKESWIPRIATALCIDVSPKPVDSFILSYIS